MIDQHSTNKSLRTPTSQTTAAGPQSQIMNDRTQEISQEALVDQVVFRTMQNKSPTSTAYSSKSNVKKKYSNKLSHNYGGQFQMFNASGAMIPTASQASTTNVSRKARGRSSKSNAGNRIKNSNSFAIIQQQHANIMGRASEN